MFANMPIAPSIFSDYHNVQIHRRQKLVIQLFRFQRHQFGRPWCTCMTVSSPTQRHAALRHICVSLSAGKSVLRCPDAPAKVSTVLQGARALGFSVDTPSAEAMPALLSTKIWHTPIPPVINTGMVWIASRHSLCKPAPPRAISISMYLSIRSIY